MSFREKAAWISLAVTVGVWGWYFWKVWATWGSDVDLVGLFVRSVILSVVVQLILQAVAHYTTPEAERSIRDEREDRIESRATGVGYTLLTVLVITLAIASPAIIGGFGSLPHDLIGDAAVAVPNLIILSVIIAEAFRSVTAIAFYRLGR